MRIVFICAGNICRSPLAAAMLERKRVETAHDGLEIVSFGLVAAGGEAPIEATLEVARRVGLDLSQHRARRFTAEVLRGDDQVWVMEEAQRRDVLVVSSMDQNRVGLLGLLATGFADEVADPGGGTDADFDRCVAHLQAAIDSLWVRLCAPRQDQYSRI